MLSHFWLTLAGFLKGDILRPSDFPPASPNFLPASRGCSRAGQLAGPLSLLRLVVPMAAPLARQVDEWLELQQQSFVDLVTSAETTYKKLCVELDATETALEVEQHHLPKPPAPPPAPVEARRPAAYPTLDDRYPNIARVAAQRLQRLSESPEFSSEPPKPRAVPIAVPQRLVLLPSPLVMATLRHILLRSSLIEMRAGLQVRKLGTLAQQRVAQAGAMRRWQLGRRSPLVEPAPRQAGPTVRRAWRAWQLWANDRQGGECGSEVLRPCRVRSVLASWRGAASERASGKARMDAAAQLASRRLDTAALRQWRVWGRRTQQWQRRAEHRARAAGGAHLQHLPSMRAFDARATFVEAGSAEMAKSYRRRRVMAVTFGRWLGGMHLLVPREEPRPADLFILQATVQHI